MIGQRKVNICEEKPMKYIEHGGGCEVISNDGTLRIELHHSMVMLGSMESEHYYTEVYILEDGGWLKTINSENFNSLESFIQSLNNSDDFTQALTDYESIKK